MSDDRGAPKAATKKRFPASIGTTGSPLSPAKQLWGKLNNAEKQSPHPVNQTSHTGQAKVPQTVVTKKNLAFTTSQTNQHLSTSSGGMEAARQRMVERLYKQGIRHEGVLLAMKAVPRHIFVDTAFINQAYEDTSLPIGLGQTISKPSVVARMLELLMPDDGKKMHRVLDIGTGCGYQAAVLSHLVEEVYSIERLKGLHERARVNLRPLRLGGVHLIYGDGMLGFPSGAPYDAIIAAAGGDDVPAAWLEQLAEQGHMIAPITSSNGTQSLIKVVRTSQGWQQYNLEEVQFVPLKSGVL